MDDRTSSIAQYHLTKEGKLEEVRSLSGTYDYENNIFEGAYIGKSGDYYHGVAWDWGTNPNADNKQAITEKEWRQYEEEIHQNEDAAIKTFRWNHLE